MAQSLSTVLAQYPDSDDADSISTSPPPIIHDMDTGLNIQGPYITPNTDVEKQAAEFQLQHQVPHSLSHTATGGPGDLLEVENAYTSENFLIDMSSCEEDLESMILKSIGVRAVNVEKYYYCIGSKTYNIVKGNANGFKTFIKVGGRKLFVVPKVAGAKRKLRAVEKAGVREKLHMRKAEVASRADYLRLAKEPSVIQRLEDARKLMEQITGNINGGNLVLNRSVILCPVPDCKLGEVTVDNCGGLAAILEHLKRHPANNLAIEIRRNYVSHKNGEDLVDLSEQASDMLDISLGKAKRDKRLFDVYILQRLVRGDKSAIDDVPRHSASDYFIHGSPSQ